MASTPNSDDTFGYWEYQCQACDQWGPVNDLLLCEACDAKVQRDLIRARDWEYVAAAFGLDEAGRERLRAEVIHYHGPRNELIVEPPQRPKPRRSRRRTGK